MNNYPKFFSLSFIFILFFYSCSESINNNRDNTSSTSNELVSKYWTTVLEKDTTVWSDDDKFSHKLDKCIKIGEEPSYLPITFASKFIIFDLLLKIQTFLFQYSFS